MSEILPKKRGPLSAGRWSERYPELDESELGDSLTSALCSGDVPMLDRAEAMGYEIPFWPGAGGHLDLAMREESGASVAWMIRSRAGLASFAQVAQEMLAGSSRWSLGAMEAAGPAATQAVGLGEWLDACAESPDGARYAASLAARDPWMLILGGSPVAREWMGKWGSWERMLRSMEREGDAQAREASEAMSALTQAFAGGPGLSASRRSARVGKALAERIASPERSMAAMAAALATLPDAMLRMDSMDPVEAKWGVDGRFIPAGSKPALGGRFNARALALLGESPADLDWALARGWVGRGRVAMGATPGASVEECSPVAMMLACADSVESGAPGRLRALASAGFSMARALEEPALSKRMAHVLSRRPDLAALLESQELGASSGGARIRSKAPARL